MSRLVQWSRGAVHVQWASREFTRVSAVATFHKLPFDDGAGPASVLALDGYELQDIFGE